MVLVVKNLPANAGIEETQVQSLSQEDPLEKGVESTPEFLPGESHELSTWWATVRSVAKSQTQGK